MKILFLDVDGVLNSRRNVVAYGAYPWPNGGVAGNPKNKEENLDPLAIGMIRKLCAESSAKIVLHSTWRLHVDAMTFGEKYDLPIIDATDKEASKNRSIVLWLEANKHVTQFVVIDDDNMAWPGPMHMPQQVFTDPNNGFLLGDYLKAMEILE